MKIITILLFTLLFFACNQQNKPESDQPYNILLISIDDLRPETNFYGNEKIHSPNLDKLASQGVVFDRAYCQAPICMPSRSSFLSGVLPEHFDSTGRLNAKSLEANNLNVITMPQLFKSNGYQTVSIGKVYHHDGEDPEGWTRRYGPEEKYGGISYESGYHSDYYRSIVYRYLNAWGNKSLMDSVRPPATEMALRPDSTCPDGRVANIALTELEKFAHNDSAFFLAVGFYRPHLPFTPPKKYWDIYDRANISTADNDYSPQNGIGYHNWNELRRYGDIPRTGPLSDEKARELIHGYYASVSFIDAQVGRLMNKLKELYLEENTIVVVLGDHGWNLGEHTLWCKHSNYETSTRTAFVIKPPQVSKPRTTKALAGLIDIYPTLTELTGLELPEHASGNSLVPVLEGENDQVNERVFSLYFDSYSMKTDRYRFTRYFNPQKIRNSSFEDSTGKYELYDHVNDPEENYNLAYEPEKQELLKKLEQEMNDYGFLPEKDENL